jgi:hypothetical protein
MVSARFFTLLAAFGLASAQNKHKTSDWVSDNSFFFHVDVKPSLADVLMFCLPYPFSLLT